MIKIKIDATPQEQRKKVGRGYIGWSKSVNAAEANERGAYNATELNKLLGVPAGWVKDTFFTHEWHHCGSYYLKVEYYDLQIVREYAQSTKRKKSVRAWKKAQKETTNFGWCLVEWREFTGSRNRRLCHHCEACAIVEVRGSFAYFEDAGTQYKKR